MVINFKCLLLFFKITKVSWVVHSMHLCSDLFGKAATPKKAPLTYKIKQLMSTI